MTTITITLPDDLVKRAKEKGLLSVTALTHLIDAAIQSDESAVLENRPEYPKDLDPRLWGAVNPLAFKRGEIIGDVVNSPEIEWEACQ